MFKQLTVFLENKPGRMEEVTGCLADENINLHALSLADSTDFGILRMIVSEPEKAAAILSEKNFMVKTTEVIGVAMGHRPGSLHSVLKEIKTLDISIEYMYAFTSRHEKYSSIVVLRVADQDAVIGKLKDSNITLLGADFLKEL